MAKSKNKNITKSEQEELAKKLERFEAIKAQVSELNKEAKEINEFLEAYLDDKEVTSVAVGDRNVFKEVSGHSFDVSIKGVKVSDAKNILTRELLEKGQTHLMTINLKAAALFELQQREDAEYLSLMKKVGLVVVENHSVKIK
jgi:cell division septal protein FtsQ